MNKNFPLTCLFLLVLAFVGSPADLAEAKPVMGINFGGPADWSTELPFANVFMESRKWISQRQGMDWGKGPELDLDERGWVRRLEPGCFAETPLCTIDGGHYPSGIYTVRYRGKGKLTFMNAQIVDEQPGEIKIRVESQHGAFWVQLRETDPADYIREIQVFLPGLDQPETQPSGPWNPEFLARWKRRPRN